MAKSSSGSGEDRTPVVFSASTGVAAINIPLSQREFGDLLANLLKTPRRIAFYCVGDFLLEKKGVVNLYYLISQRISEQHRSQLVSFGVLIYYEDGKSTSLGSLEDFDAYAEIANCEAIRMEMELTFLVELPSSETPQKQSIRVSFTTERKAAPNWLNESFKGIFFSDFFQSARALKRFEIEHTHITLGNDIANILTNELERRDNRTQLRRIGESFSFRFVCAISILGLMLGICFRFLKIFVIKDLLGGTTLEEMIVSGDFAISYFLISIISLTLVALCGLAATISFGAIFEHKPSFISLSEASLLRSRAKLQKYENRLLVKFALGAIAIVSAVVSGIISAKLLELF